MSAISGILSLEGSPLPPHLIRSLMDATSACGKKYQQYWSNELVSLGQSSFLGQRHPDDQKRTASRFDGRLEIVFDGRLDNRPKLIRSLREAGLDDEMPTDAELVLGAYHAWHNHCPENLQGDFAFAIWDAAKQKLFCARDQVGARPLYYAESRGLLAFSTHDEALWRLPGFVRQPNEERIAHYFVPEFIDFDLTQGWVKGIRSLPPAHFMFATLSGAANPEPYWQFRLGREDTYLSDREAGEAFVEVFGRAVKRRLRSGKEAAALISGGMDSGGIAGMLGRFSSDLPRGKYHSYSVISDSPGSSLESRCIEKMTGSSAASKHLFSVPSFTGMLGADQLWEAAWSRAHPVDNSIIIPSLMFLAAACNGHTTVFHGAGGDVVTGNFPRYIAWLLRALQLQVAWHECKAASRNYTYLTGQSPFKLLAQNSWVACTPYAIRRGLSRVRGRSRRNAPDVSLLNPEFARKLDISVRMKEQTVREDFLQGPEFRYSHLNGVFGINGVASSLSGFQRAASRYGVDTVDPWADQDVLDFFLHLPLRYLVSNGWTKYLPRSEFEQELGSDVVWRNDKEHLGGVLIQRLMRDSAGFIRQTIRDGMEFMEPYINTARIRTELARFESGSDPGTLDFLYELTVMTLWLRRVNE